MAEYRLDKNHNKVEAYLLGPYVCPRPLESEEMLNLKQF